MIVDDELFTIDECLAMMVRVWAEIENSALEHVAAKAVAAGFDEDDVRRVIEAHAHVLAAGRSRRLQTARLMLEAGAQSLQ